MDDKSTEPRKLHRRYAINLQHLQYAIAAADQGSFRGAAESLLVRQSTLSRCIRQLEHMVGAPVFERSSAGVRPTLAGKNFLSSARSIVEQVESLTTATRLTGRGETGRLAIGFYTSLSTGNLRATIMEFTSRFPRIEIDMFERSRDQLATALRNAVIDVAIVTGDRPLRGFSSAPLWSERILAVLPEAHRLASSEMVYWTDLRGENLLLGQRDPGPAIQELLAAKIVSPEDRPKLFLFDVNRESIKSLVGACFGIGLTLEASLGADFAGVVHKEVEDGGGPARIGLSANWREDNENPALPHFLKLLNERYPSSESRSASGLA